MIAPSRPIAMRTLARTARACFLPLLGGCLLLPVGSDLRPRIGLEAVERSPAPAVRPAPVIERGERGELFVDSLIVFRTWGNAAVVRFRVWNRVGESITIFGADVARPGGCPAPEGGFELLRSGGAGTVVAPGASREYEAVAPLLAPGAGEWAQQTGDSHCFGDDRAGRSALRLAVEARGARYVYTFWYRSTDGP